MDSFLFYFTVKNKLNICQMKYSKQESDKLNLDLPDLSRILNDHILHSSQWPAIPTKLPSDILKFDGKPGEDPNNHVMTFHLWCSSNSLMDDSIRLRLF
jgi:hypothetical protein